MDIDTPPIVLCFSGHDPCGGAGVQADIEVLASLGCHGATVVTTLTVQDTRNIIEFHTVDSMLLVAQARAVLEDMPVAAIKVGMSGNVATIEAIHTVIKDYPDLPVIVDPVLSAEGGTEVATSEEVDALRSLLMPLATIVTPNNLELERLAVEADCQESRAQELMEMGAEYVLVTGTHAENKDVTNILWGHKRWINACDWPRLPNKYHGSGCTLASALAGFLAHGMAVEAAVRDAQAYTWNSLKWGRRMGMGQFMPNRFFWTQDDDGTFWQKGN